MEPRDVFDGLLVAILGILVYVRIIRPSLSGERFDTVVEALLSLDLVFYLVLAAILGVGYVCYIVLYLPQKQSQHNQQTR